MKMTFNLFWPHCPDHLRQARFFPRPEPIQSRMQAWLELRQGVFNVVMGALFLYTAFKLAVGVEHSYRLLSRSFQSIGMSKEELVITALVYSIFQWKIGPDAIGWFGREYIGQVTYPRIANSISYLLNN